MPNFSHFSRFFAVAALSALGACAGTVDDSLLASGPAAYEAISAEPIAAPTAYLIQPDDKLKLQVFGEPEISADEMRVDEAGFIQIPLIGSVQASDREVTDVRNEISERLTRGYLVDPKVTLSVTEPVPRYVSVEGDVNQPGVYELGRQTTLLSALARAQSPTETSKLDSVVILRTVDGQKMAGSFDLRAIRGGLAPDPQIFDNDVVVVGSDGGKLFLEGMQRVVAPIITGVFYMLR